MATVVWDGMRYVAGGGVFAYSYDGKNWTTITPFSEQYASELSITWNGTYYIVVLHYSGGFKIKYSTDLITWLDDTSGVPAGYITGLTRPYILSRNVLPRMPQNSVNGLVWTVYTPIWTASVTNPSIGNGTIVGRYKQIGKTTFVSMKLTMGSSTTFGSGNWHVTLPVTAVNTDAVILNTVFYQSSGSHFYQGMSWTVAYPTYVILVVNQGATESLGVTDTIPFTWASGDTLTITGSYEAA